MVAAGINAALVYVWHINGQHISAALCVLGAVVAGIAALRNDQ